MEIRIANRDSEILDCFEVISELRPHLKKDDFVTLIHELIEGHSYQLVYLTDTSIKSVMGIRIGKWLHAGKYLEIEDLITLSDSRSKGYGEKLLLWAKEYAKNNSCSQVRLVSGAARERAHSFYQNLGMSYEAKYFSVSI